MGRIAALIGCLVAAFVIFYVDAKSPTPAPANAPASAFSAERAMVDIRIMGATPHPIGSEANHKVRDYLIGRMQGLGLSPTVQEAESVYAPPRWGVGAVGATVQNIIGVLPGKDRSKPALALMAHYDSVPNSPGAADDAAGVASVLEMVRVIRAKGQPARDVMVLITDGEETGLLGANAFWDSHPLASHVGYVLNLESRGGGGRASMFQTLAGNGGDIALLRGAAPNANSNSLGVFIYKQLPNDTDMSVSLAHGVPGMNVAFIGRQFDYHSPSSTPAALDVGAVQSMGDLLLNPAIKLAFGSALPARAPDVVYGNLPFGPLVAYQPAGGWVLLLLSAALAGYGAWAARRAKAFSWRDLWKGLGASVLLLLLAVALLEITRLATGAGFGFIAQRELLARFPAFETAMALAGLAAVLVIPTAMVRGKGRVIGAVAMLLAGLAVAGLGHFTPVMNIIGAAVGAGGGVLCLVLLGRPAGVSGVWTGLIFVGLAASLALQIAAPTAALAVSWPVTAACLVSAITAAGTRQGRVAQVIGRIAALVVMALGLAWTGNFLHGFMQALDLAILPAVVIWIGAPILWPLAWPQPGASRWSYAPAAVALVAALGIATWLNVSSPWSPRYPDTAMPLYVVEHDTGKAWRAAPRSDNAWTRAVLTADGGPVSRRKILGDMMFVAPAKPVSAATPPITVVHGEDGTVTLTAPWSAQTEAISLQVKVNTLVVGATINGKPVSLFSKPGQTVSLRWSNAPGGLRVTLKPVGPGAVDVDYGVHLKDWPAEAIPLPARPADLALFGNSGSTVVTGKLHATW